MRLRFAVLFLAAFVPGFAEAQEPRFYAKSELAIRTAGGKHAFTVELARTDAERAHGLMFRKTMPVDHGVVLDYGTPQPAFIWMKNTLLPLDIVFIAADGTIESIGTGVPHSEKTIASKGAIRAVLELNAGTTRLLGIKPGDKVEHALFGTAP